MNASTGAPGASALVSQIPPEDLAAYASESEPGEAPSSADPARMQALEKAVAEASPTIRTPTRVQKLTHESSYEPPPAQPAAPSAAPAPAPPAAGAPPPGPPAKPRTQSFGPSPEELAAALVPPPVSGPEALGEDVRAALGGPLRGTGLVMIVVGTALLSALSAVKLGGIFGLFAYYVLWNYFTVYAILVLRAVSSGRRDLPDAPGGHDLKGLTGQAIACVLSSVLPMIVVLGVYIWNYAASSGQVNHILYIAGILVTCAAGSYVYPMAVLMTTLFSNAELAVSYPALLHAIGRTKGSYTLVFFLYLILNVSLSADVATLAPIAERVPIFGVVIYNAVFWALYLHGTLAFMILLGRFYRRQAGSLGWFSTQALPIYAAPEAPRSTANLGAPRERDYMLKREETGPDAPIGEKLSSLFGDQRNRDVVFALVALLVAFLCLKSEMKHRRIDEEIEKIVAPMGGSGDFHKDIVDLLEKNGVSGCKPNEVQLLFWPSPVGGRGVFVHIVIRSSSAGFYLEHESASSGSVFRATDCQFKSLENKSEIWQIPAWPRALRWAGMLAGLIVGLVFGLKAATGGQH